MRQITAPPRRQPNILTIMVDQQRWDYLGYMGADWVDTPTIDRLAARGAIYTHCFTNAPVCAPARTALACGLRPHRIGATDNSCYVPRGLPTYYGRVRDAGYHVGCVGKLDLAKPEPYNGPDGCRPRTFSWGFTHPVEAEGKMHAGNSATPHGPYTQYLADRGLLAAFHADYQARSSDWIGHCHDSVLPTEAFEDRWIGHRAAQWISDIPGDFPWHLFVSFVGPHDPFDPPTEYADRYRDRDMPDSIAHSPGQSRAPRYENAASRADDVVTTCKRQYCAAITAIDDAIAEILAALEPRGWADDTVIIFSSDHGEQLYDHQLWTKSVPYESSIRVPLLISGPGIQPGQRLDTLVELIDIGETVCDLAGAPDCPGVDARSLLPTALGLTDSHRDEVVTVLTNFRCLRDSRWKFVANIGHGAELYDLQTDPTEQHNVIADHAPIASAMNARLTRQLASHALPR